MKKLIINFLKKLRKISIISIVVIFCLLSLGVAAYFIGQFFMYRYVNKWADKLIDLDNRGLLSNSFGAAWKDVLNEEEMRNQVVRVAGNKKAEEKEQAEVKGIKLENYPSLKIVEKLNQPLSYSNRIIINDRSGLKIAEISTDHARLTFDSLPGNLITAIVAAEDKTFFTNNYGFDYHGFTRAIIKAGLDFFKTKKFRPKGTSTITQQVAKMFVSQLDNDGQRIVPRSVDRKIQEIRIAAALRKRYTPQDIMTIYFNHCITSSYGLVGVRDIASQLWGKPVSQLSDAEAIYVARMVKWGMNYPEKIRNQCKIDMPRIQKAFGWDDEKSAQVLLEINELGFAKPKQIVSENEHLIDLANIYWLNYLQKKGYSAEMLEGFDILNSSSLIRLKGNLTINTTIDLPLQRTLDSLVSQRGFAKYTTIEGVEKSQYYAYSIIDSKTGKLLAYSSLDRIGSRAAALLSRRIPNGSSTAKPILNALMFDLGIFYQNQKFDDTKEVDDTVAWAREIGANTVYFTNTADKKHPYKVQNSGRKMAGNHYIFDLLTSSNNILAVETIYRLNAKKAFDEEGNITDEGFVLGLLFYRLGILEKMQKEFAEKEITGVRVYKEIARIVGAAVDKLSDYTYSVALGTLELTLLEQVHLFNMFYDNKIIQNPANNPSLFIDEIVMQDEIFRPYQSDTIVVIRPFSDLQNIAPSAIGMHNRLAGPYDGLSAFDIPENYENFSNLAKSGTSDDILRPYNASSDSNEKTNYCLWNAIIRVDLSKFGSPNGTISDITISCVGEGNKKSTGPADGKSMHKYLTSAFLKIGGVPIKDGFYKNYETFLRSMPEDDENISSQEGETQSLEEILNTND
ncbi:MAG: transglycosylase domain-containing protein [Chitinivibrionia bacterium]|nr:transglycosylase domain-containing protein [Chitinivibrionia bacterium]